MACKACHRDLQIVARDLCRACYQRWWKRGTTEYAPKRERQKCQIPDCDKWVVSNGLCGKHRQRLRRHGHTEQTRPDDWGAKGWGRKDRHPLYHSWMWLKRSRPNELICEEWRSDFLQFVADVGERPSNKHKLFVADETKPIGPRNFIWKKTLVEKVEGEDKKTYQARFQRAYRQLRPGKYKEYSRKTMYGISREQYVKLRNEQGNKCAICRNVEQRKVRGKVTELSVDHCHTTGKVRGLLCSGCNQGLGNFKDDIDRLRKAVDYLESNR